MAAEGEPSFLTAKQSEFVSKGEGSGTLEGVPGGGKTTAIIERLKEQHRRGEVHPERRAIVLYLGNAQAKDMALRIQEEGLGHCVFAKTFQSVAGSIYVRMTGQDNMRLSDYKKTLFEATDFLRARGVDALKRQYKSIANVIVDEAQDLDASLNDLLGALEQALAPSVVLVGDPTQAIYQFRNGSEKYMALRDGWRIYLDQVKRCPADVVEIASIMSGRAMWSELPRCRPTLHRFRVEDIPDNERMRLARLVSSLKEEGSVCVISSVNQAHITPMLSCEWARSALEDHGSRVHPTTPYYYTLLQVRQAQLGPYRPKR